MTMTAANKDAGTRTRTLKRIPSNIPAIAPAIRKRASFGAFFAKAIAQGISFRSFLSASRRLRKPNVLRCLAHALASDALTDLAQPVEVDHSRYYQRPVKNRTCGPLLKVRSRRAHVQAIQQTDVMIVFPRRDGKLMSSRETLPSVTACRCSQRASMAQLG
jgi:hypothetical protein